MTVPAQVVFWPIVLWILYLLFRVVELKTRLEVLRRRNEELLKTPGREARSDREWMPPTRVDQDSPPPFYFH